MFAVNLLSIISCPMASIHIFDNLSLLLVHFISNSLMLHTRAISSFLHESKRSEPASLIFSPIGTYAFMISSPFITMVFAWLDSLHLAGPIKDHTVPLWVQSWVPWISSQTSTLELGVKLGVRFWPDPHDLTRKICGLGYEFLKLGSNRVKEKKKPELNLGGPGPSWCRIAQLGLGPAKPDPATT